MPSFRGHHIMSRTSLYVEGEDVAEAMNGAVAIKKGFEEFSVGDEVEAVIRGKKRFGTLCSINAENDVLLAAPWKFMKLLQPNETVIAKIETIDLEKRKGTVSIPNLAELVKGRNVTRSKKESSPTAKTPAQTKVKKEIVVDPVAVEVLKGMELGQALSGKVFRKNRFGIWFDVGSAIRPKAPLRKPENKILLDKLRFGEEVQLKVTNIDVAQGLCSVEVEDIETLVAGRPERKEISALEAGSVHVGHVASIKNSRIFVDIDYVKDGRIQSSDLYQLGQEVTVKVASIDFEKNQFELEPVTE